MLTSEQQKIYNVKVPKGGYGYYTLYHGIYDPAKNIDERPAYAQTGDLFEPEGSSVVYKATRKNGKTTWAIDENAQRQSESGESGGGSGGGGAEKFVVTLTEENDTWTADKTVAEIVAADAAGKIVVAKYPFNGMHFDIPLSFAETFNYDMIAFATTFWIEQNALLTIFINANNDGPEDSWNVNVTNIEIPNAPLIVTLTAGSTEGQFVGDKTYKEVFDAFVAGTNCIAHYTSDDGEGVISCTDANCAGTVYEINFGSSITATGSANDYITISMGG